MYMDQYLFNPICSDFGIILQILSRYKDGIFGHQSDYENYYRKDFTD